MKMHVTNPHFCKWLKMECLFRVNQPNFFIILCYQAFGRPKLTSCRFSFFNITICSPNLCNWANKLLDKNMFYSQGSKLRTNPKLERLICEFPKSNGWRTWRRTSVVLVLQKKNQTDGQRCCRHLRRLRPCDSIPLFPFNCTSNPRLKCHRHKVRISK